MTRPALLNLPPGYSMRDWTATDLTDVTALDAEIFGTDAWSRELFESEYQASTASTPHTFYRVIEAHGTLIGFVGLLYGPPYADITTIGVHPAHTGKHLGAALLVWAIRTAHDLGAQDLLLEVRADNTVAQQLYARNGFTHIHTRAKYYPGGVDAWIMRKHLRAHGPSSAAALSSKE